jgi:cytosine/adenosine deaminase-related metal-dependent hydrolase
MTGPPLEGGGLRLVGEKILEVVPRPGRDSLDLGDVALWPGLVNAHTHLEFSLCRRPFQADAGFADWIHQVVAYRREQLVDPASESTSGSGDGRIHTGEDTSKARAVGAGLSESWRRGVALVGDIATWPYPIEPRCDEAAVGHDLFFQAGAAARYPARRVFAEGIAPTDSRAAQAADQCRRLLESLGLPSVDFDPGGSPGRAGRLAPGLSPHAPYTVHPRLLTELVRLAVRCRWPLAMHLAETPEEIEWLRSRSGPLADMRDAMGLGNAWPDGLRSVAGYLELLAAAERVLVVHGNYLERESIDFLARHRDRMAVVYCPRTHAHVQHAPHPAGALLRRGVSVLLGTDSRASNPDLCILAEARQLLQAHPELDPWQIVDIITRQAARWLGAEADFGSFRAGSSPGINVTASRQRRPEGLAEELLGGGRLEPLSQWLARC